MTFIPDTLGDKNIGKNFYGNNYFLASSINFDIATNVQLIGSYTHIFGPGHNSFDENLKFQRNPIYSYGFNWNLNPIIGIEGKITNGYGVDCVIITASTNSDSVVSTAFRCCRKNFR